MRYEDDDDAMKVPTDGIYLISLKQRGVHGTLISSLALFWPCVEGVKDTVRSKPAEPAGGNVPEAGHTLNSLAPPCRNTAENGSAFLETAH